MADIRRTRARWWTKITRDLVLFSAGLGLTIREGLSTGQERPSLYVLYAGMMGLGPILRYAEKHGRDSGREDSR